MIRTPMFRSPVSDDSPSTKRAPRTLRLTCTPRRVGQFAVALAACALLSLGATGCDRKGEATPTLGEAASEEKASRHVTGPVVETIPVETLTVALGGFESEYRAAGVVEPEDQVTVAAEVSGRITRMDLELGDDVKAGEPIVEVDDSSVQAQIKKIDAQIGRVTALLETARRDLARETELFENNAGVERVLDSARSLVETYQAELSAMGAEREAATVELEKHAIEAPIGGLIAERFAEKGEFAMPGMKLYRIENPEAVECVFSLAERDVIRIKPGDAMKVTIDALGGQEFDGVVSRIAPSGDTRTRTFETRVRVLNPHPHPIRAGMSCVARVVRARYENVVVLPQEAIVRENESAHVLLVEGDMIRRSDPVTIGEADAGRAIVTAGLSPGQAVVILGQYAVKPGDIVRVRRSHEEIPVRVFD